MHRLSVITRLKNHVRWNNRTTEKWPWDNGWWSEKFQNEHLRNPSRPWFLSSAVNGHLFREPASLVFTPSIPVSGRVYQPHHDSVMAFSPRKKSSRSKRTISRHCKKITKVLFSSASVKEVIFFFCLPCFVYYYCWLCFILIFLFANWRPVHFSQLIVFLPCLYVITITGMRT